ncbi:MAG: hypothetical protein HC902_08455 [Calothrix sp. SM1_5_4]|nr:hypothetical protein [Calothrix sp. SM1_5_4]
MNELFPENYLAEFYAEVLNVPIDLNRPAANIEVIWRVRGFSGLTGLRRAVETGGTLAEALKEHPKDKLHIYQCLHYLVLSRSVSFADVNKARSLGAMSERYSRLYADLKDLTPDKVFEYFGAKELRPSFIERIADEYVKSNSPEQLPKDAPQDLIDSCRKCFEIVVGARDVLMDEQKRNALLETLNSESKERARKANELISQGLDFLRKGQFKKAQEVLVEAGRNHPSTLQFLVSTWAEVKATPGISKSRLFDLLKKVESLSPEDRRSAYYFMVLGVVKKALGDSSAQAAFERVVEMDSQFVEARRELNSFTQPTKKVDILHADLGEIVSQLFRRKAE